VVSAARGDPFLRRELSGFALLFARGGAVLLAAATLVVFAHLFPRWLELRDQQAAAFREGATGGVLRIAQLGTEALSILAVLVCWSVAGIVLWRRSRDGLGILVALAFSGLGPLVLDFSVIREIALGMGVNASEDEWALSRPVILIATAFVLPFPFIFPDGRVIPRWGALLLGGWFAVALFRTITGYDPEGVAAAVALTTVLAIAGFAYRYTLSGVAQRQQIKWIVLAATAGVVVYLLTFPPLFVPALQSGPLGFAYRVSLSAVQSLAGAFLAVATAIAIFRQGLMNIDLLINRAAVYAMLTAILAGLFGAAAVVAARAFEAIAGVRSDLVAVLAVVPVGILFMPLRSWLLRFADRFVSDRVVVTVLFIDIAGSTARAAEIGDKAYRELLGRFRATVRRELGRFGGREIDTAGDGFFATFEGPGQAIRCALEIARAVKPIGLEVRAGLHIGEVEAHGRHVTGLAVHIGARIAALASPGEVLVSRTLRDLVSGSNLGLRDRGTHLLKGVPGDWQLYAAST